jgi:flavin reductase (DIM6/NTAB) family NADH-FMN oxidoreductase RutF
MQINNIDIQNMEQRFRGTFINSLAGAKQAVLIGSQSANGVANLGIFNSIIHFGANPALYGFVCRPDTVPRDTLTNILDSKQYTFNFVKDADYQKAHQTSARYDVSVSEFTEVGFTPEYLPNWQAPFVQEAVVKIGLQFEQKIDIALNGTIIIIGSIQHVIIADSIIGIDGFVDLASQNVMACAGLDAYYTTKLLGRLSYAKPNTLPKVL